MTKSFEARPHPKLGNSQRYVLKALKKHRGWYPMCGWIWNTRSGTIRILDSLVKRGLADFDSKQYKITTEGEIALDTCNG